MASPAALQVCHPVAEDLPWAWQHLVTTTRTTLAYIVKALPAPISTAAALCPCSAPASAAQALTAGALTDKPVAQAAAIRTGQAAASGLAQQPALSGWQQQQ